MSVPEFGALVFFGSVLQMMPPGFEDAVFVDACEDVGPFGDGDGAFGVFS